jgi:hypothetical protein
MYRAAYLCGHLKPVNLYKRLTALFFLLAFVSQCFSRTLIVADYYANTSAYSKKCENKARPKMHCNGKCQMMKKLKMEEEKEAKDNDRKAENKVEVLSSKSFFPVIAFPKIEIRTAYPVFYSPYLACRNADIFHPPQ